MDDNKLERYNKLKETHVYIRDYLDIFKKESHDCYLLGEATNVSKTGFVLYKNPNEFIYINYDDPDFKEGFIIKCFISFTRLNAGHVMLVRECFAFDPAGFTSIQP